VRVCGLAELLARAEGWQIGGKMFNKTCPFGSQPPQSFQQAAKQTQSLPIVPRLARTRRIYLPAHNKKHLLV